MNKRLKRHLDNSPRDKYCSGLFDVFDVFDIFGGRAGADAATEAARIQAGASTESARLITDAIREAAERQAIAGPAAGEIQAGGALAAAQLQAGGIEGLSQEQVSAALQAAGIQQGAFQQAGDIGSQAALEAARIQQQFGGTAIGEIQRQFGVTQANLTPFLQAGTGALGDLQRGATVAGLDERLGQLASTDIFGTLSEERGRAAQGQLAAGGLTRSGTGLLEAARVPTELLLGLESRLQGRQQQLAGQGLTAGLNLGQFGQVSGQNIANLLQSQGFAGAQGVLGAAGARTQALTQGAAAQALGIQQAGQARGQGIFGVGQALAQGQLGATGARAAGLLAGAGAEAAGLTGVAQAQAAGLLGAGQATAQGILTGQQARAAGQQNILNTALGVAGIFFSDPNLKENIKTIDEVMVSRGTLQIVEWDWIVEAPDIVKICPSLGFLSPEVKALYPEYVGEFGGFDVIFYDELLNHLRAH